MLGWQASKMLEAEKKTHKMPAMHHKLGVPPATKPKLNMTSAMTKAEVKNTARR
jgi:hypothetical protein